MADNGAAPAGSPDAAGNAAAGAEGVSVAAAGAGEGAGAGAPAAADCGGATSGTQADASGTSAGAGAGDATEAAGAKGGGGEAAGEATVVATQTLQVLDTRLTADCVEACPATFDGCSDVVVLGTYELNTETRVKSGQLTVFTVQGAHGDDACGAGSTEDNKDAPTLVSESVVDTSALLDAKWCWRPVGGKRLLGVAAFETGLHVFSLEDGDGDDAPRFTLRPHFSADIDADVALSLDWSNRVHATESPRIAVSRSDGMVSLFDTSDAGATLVHEWSAHSYFGGAGAEVWITAFNQWSTDVVYTGGDDCKLRAWDTRDGCSYATAEIEEHTTGVCALQTSPHHPHILVSGSYDETILVWDTRNLSKSLASAQCGGGVWRLKFHPNPEHANLLLAACNYAGFQVFDVSMPDLGAPLASGPADAAATPTRIATCLEAAPSAHAVTSMERRVTYSKHESLAYGVDWVATPHNLRCATPLIASASFYDRVMHLWRPKASHKLWV